MAKWAAIFLVIMLAAAVAGFLFDAIRFVAGALFLICAVGLAFSVFRKSRAKAG